MSTSQTSPPIRHTLIYTIQQKLKRTNGRYLMGRALLYTTLAVLAGGGYALLVAGLSLLAMPGLDARSPWLTGAVIFILALLLNPLRVRTQAEIDRVFFRGETAATEKAAEFEREISRVVEVSGILRILREYIEESLQPSVLHVFVYDPPGDQYLASPDELGSLTSDLRFSTSSPLTHFLASQHSAILVDRSVRLPVTLKPEAARLALLRAQVILPLPGRKRLGGWAAIGPRRSGESYTSRDLRYLESLAGAASLAIDRAQVVVSMENRVREMNVLARVAQGVNITVAFDDLLELIYAQTTQLLPTRDFRLTLTDPSTGVIRHAFYLENDERFSERENQPLPVGQDLEVDLIGTGRALLLDDYTQDCQRRGVVPAWPGIYAWMGVPLNAGAETIGSLALGSRNPSAAYTEEQLNLVQAIADQTAGAIVKARLLQETERRARQLSSINEVTRQLTSTLELEPLLKSILQSAVNILNCEAGSLLLVDEHTDELVFRVAAGPVADTLVGKRMPAGSGVAGKSVKSHEPVIVNDVQSTPAWSANNDQETGFITRGLLVTPLEVKDQVIGVIEVINKRDLLPFTRDDLNLLTAFAGQAAVAIENARLYTMTDHALAERVEELSVMQRIDRELNTSLDISLAMRITLEWAMRQSAASAGLVGMILDSGVHIMASQGYADEMAPYQEADLPLDAAFLQPALKTGLPQHQPVSAGQAGAALLVGARTQLVVPIRREGSTMGIILLESLSPEPPSEDATEFLTRLSDHAAIAIANAQLYAAVQAANLAKSEFVSFVSHELKNPMTSIKGYTELLAAGAVGPVSEAQANFLGTIRSNVERMSTLVSDLADVSRIEAGRLRLDFISVPAKEITDEVLRSVRRQAEEKEHALDVALPADLPAMWADRTRVIQIMTNLVSNAIKYTPQAGKITIGAENVDNQWDPAGAARVVHVWVQDSGIGIAPEDQKKIFQKFFRSEDPKTREAPGTGLGLNITKSLVEMQGGQIWFESVFRQGTTFHFTLPVAE